jgi:PAS domain S-box-containing protein
LDASGKILDVNCKTLEISGYQREQLIGKSYTFMAEMPVQLLDVCTCNLSKGNLWHGIVKHKTRDGSYAWLDLNLIPSLDQNGMISRIHFGAYQIRNNSIGSDLYNQQAIELGLPMSMLLGESTEEKSTPKKKGVQRKFQVNSKAA